MIASKQKNMSEKPRNPVIDFGNRLAEPFSTEKWWSLRRKSLQSQGLLRYFRIFRYLRMVDRQHAFLPLEAEIKDCPVFPHGISGIYISCGSRIGSGCTIFHQVTIGSNTFPNSKRFGSPVIGNDVFIGAGAKIIGNVTVGNHVRIGANCVVTEDIPANCTVVSAKPRIIPKDEGMNNNYQQFEN